MALPIPVPQERPQSLLERARRELGTQDPEEGRSLLERARAQLARPEPPPGTSLSPELIRMGEALAYPRGRLPGDMPTISDVYDVEDPLARYGVLKRDPYERATGERTAGPPQPISGPLDKFREAFREPIEPPGVVDAGLGAATIPEPEPEPTGPSIGPQPDPGPTEYEYPTRGVVRDLAESVQRGFGQGVANVGELTGEAAEQFGFPYLAKALAEAGQEAGSVVAGRPGRDIPPPPTLSQDPVLGSAALLGQGLPTMVPAMVAGGAGAGIGARLGMAAGGARGAALGARLPTIGTELGRRLGQGLGAAQGAKKGATLGAMAGSFVLGVGDIRRQAESAGWEPSAARTAATIGVAVPYAALDAVLPQRILTRFGAGNTERARGVLRSMLADATLEGGTEGAQNFLTQLTSILGTGHGELDIKELLTEAYAGALTGGAVGGVSAALSPAPAAAPEPEITERDLELGRPGEIVIPAPDEVRALPPGRYEQPGRVEREPIPMGPVPPPDPAEALQSAIDEAATVEVEQLAPETGRPITPARERAARRTLERQRQEQADDLGFLAEITELPEELSQTPAERLEAQRQREVERGTESATRLAELAEENRDALMELPEEYAQAVIQRFRVFGGPKTQDYLRDFISDAMRRLERELPPTQADEVSDETKSRIQALTESDDETVRRRATGMQRLIESGRFDVAALERGVTALEERDTSTLLGRARDELWGEGVETHPGAAQHRDYYAGMSDEELLESYRKQLTSAGRLRTKAEEMEQLSGVAYTTSTLEKTGGTSDVGWRAKGRRTQAEGRLVAMRNEMRRRDMDVPDLQAEDIYLDPDPQRLDVDNREKYFSGDRRLPDWDNDEIISELREVVPELVRSREPDTEEAFNLLVAELSREGRGIDVDALQEELFATAEAEVGEISRARATAGEEIIEEAAEPSPAEAQPGSDFAELYAEQFGAPPPESMVEYPPLPQALEERGVTNIPDPVDSAEDIRGYERALGRAERELARTDPDNTKKAKQLRRRIAHLQQMSEGGRSEMVDVFGEEATEELLGQQPSTLALPEPPVAGDTDIGPPADEDVEAAAAVSQRVQRTSQARQDEVSRRRAAVGSVEPKAVRLQYEGGGYDIIAPSAKQPEKWQRTAFDADGTPIRDVLYDDLDSALVADAHNEAAEIEVSPAATEAPSSVERTNLFGEPVEPTVEQGGLFEGEARPEGTTPDEERGLAGEALTGEDMARRATGETVEGAEEVGELFGEPGPAEDERDVDALHDRYEDALEDGDVDRVREVGPALDAAEDRALDRAAAELHGTDPEAATVEPSMPGGPAPWERRGATVEDTELRPIATVELVKLVTAIIGRDKIFLRRYPGARGAFYPDPGDPQIGLNPNLGKDYQQFARTLAHEIGHLIDFLPDRSMSKGNILGRIAAIPGYLKSTIDAQPTDPSRALTPADRAKIRRAAEKRVGTRPSKDNAADLAAWQNEVSIVYAEMIVNEMEARNLIGQERIMEELRLVSAWWRPWDRTSASPSYVKYRDSSPELYADAMSVLLNSPGSLQERAPTFFDAMLSYMDAKPDFQAAYNEIQDLLGEGTEALYQIRKQDIELDYAAYEDRAKKAEEAKKEPVLSFFSDLARIFVDRAAPLLTGERARARGERPSSPERNLEMLIQEFNHSDNVNRTLLMDISADVDQPLREAGVSSEQAGMYLQMVRIADGDRGGMQEKARETIMDLMGEESWDAAREAYIQLGEEEVHDLEGETFDPDLLALADDGILNPKGYTPTEAREQLDGLRDELGAETFAELEMRMKLFRDLLFQSVEEAVRLGVYSEKVFQESILPVKDTYAPFSVVDHFYGRVPPGVRRQVGTLKGIGNPYTAGILKTMALNRLNEYQKVKLGILDVLQTDFPLQLGDEQRIDRHHREKPAGKGKANLIYHVDGKLRYREVDQYVADVLERVDLGSLQRISDLLSGSYGFFHPLYVSLSLGWQARNLYRDLKRTYKNLATAHAGKPTYAQAVEALLDIPRLVSAYKEVRGDAWANAKRRDSQRIREMLDDRALGRAFHSFEANDGALTHERLLQRYGIMEPEHSGFRGFLETFPLTRGIQELGIFQETWSKAAAYKLLGDQGITGRERAFLVRNFVGTPDSTVRGMASDLVNGLYMYSNVILAGLRADAKVASNPTTASGYWFRSFLMDFLPKAGMAAAAAGAFGEELKEWLDRIPSYDIEKYIIMPVNPYTVGALGAGTGALFGGAAGAAVGGLAGAGIGAIIGSETTAPSGAQKSVYLRIPHDDANRIIAGAVWAKMMEDRPYSWGHASELVAGEFPGVNPAIDIPIKWGQVFANRNPYDSFRQRNVVPRTEWEAGGVERYKEVVRWTAQQLGVISQGMTFVNPEILYAGAIRDEDRSFLESNMRRVPGLSTLIKASDRGLHESMYWEIDAERQARAKLKTRYSPEVDAALSERNRLNQFGEERLEPYEAERRRELNAWYRRYYLPLSQLALEADEAGNDAGRDRAIDEMHDGLVTPGRSRRPRRAPQPRQRRER